MWSFTRFLIFTRASSLRSSFYLTPNHFVCEITGRVYCDPGKLAEHTGKGRKHTKRRFPTMVVKNSFWKKLVASTKCTSTSVVSTNLQISGENGRVSVTDYVLTFSGRGNGTTPCLRSLVNTRSRRVTWGVETGVLVRPRPCNELSRGTNRRREREGKGVSDQRGPSGRNYLVNTSLGEESDEDLSSRVLRTVRTYTRFFYTFFGVQKHER